MTLENIRNIVISTKWEIHPDIKNCKDVECSEMVVFLNDNISFSVHALRKKKEYPFSFVVTLFKPERKYGLTLDDIDNNLLSSDIEYYVSSKLLENKEIHKRFLDNLNKTIITI